MAKDTKEIVGGIGFFGNPDLDGMIEIGFAINESQRRKGYCFEAAQKLLNWSQIMMRSNISQPDVNLIISIQKMFW